MYKIELLDVFNPQWDDIVKSFPNYDVYYLKGYVKPFQLHGDGEPILFLYESDRLRAIYVFMKRDLGNGYFDVVTPYGYGGVLFDGDINHENLDEFINAFSSQMKDENIVDNFVRYHPVLENAEAMRSISTVIDLGKTISMDLASIELIWANITSKNRNMIRKAEKNGITIKHTTDLKFFEDFKRIYDATMLKDNAEKYYYFSPSFYESLHKELSNNFKLFYAELEGEIISMSIMLFANGHMHYHLSGSLLEYRNLAPSNLLLYKAACWGCEQGFKDLHLGGGLGSGEDGLYKFKAGFNRNASHQFSIGKQIFDEDKYQKLVEERISKDSSFNKNSNFFPLYRG